MLCGTAGRSAHPAPAAPSIRSTNGTSNPTPAPAGPPAALQVLLCLYPFLWFRLYAFLFRQVGPGGILGWAGLAGWAGSGAEGLWSWQACSKAAW